jgi:hypothetical protein
MEQAGYCNLSCLWTRPNIALRLFATYRKCDYPGRMTKIHWHPIDAHCQDGAGRVLQSVRPIKAVKNSYKTDCNISAVWLPRTHDQKAWTLCQYSCSRWSREQVIILLPINAANTWLCITMSESTLNSQTYITYNYWCSVDTDFTMCVSTICNHFLCGGPSFTLFWQPF